MVFFAIAESAARGATIPGLAGCVATVDWQTITSISADGFDLDGREALHPESAPLDVTQAGFHLCVGSQRDYGEGVGVNCIVSVKRDFYYTHLLELSFSFVWPELKGLQWRCLYCASTRQAQLGIHFSKVISSFSHCHFVCLCFFTFLSACLFLYACLRVKLWNALSSTAVGLDWIHWADRFLSR